MRYNSHNGAKTANKKDRIKAPLVIVDFGERTISSQNFSKMVALPKQALANCGTDVKHVNVKLVQTDSEKFLKLTPVASKRVNDNDDGNKEERA